MRQSLIDFKMWLYKRYDFNIPNRHVDEYLAEKSIKQPHGEASSVSENEQAQEICVCLHDTHEEAMASIMADGTCSVCRKQIE